LNRRATACSICSRETPRREGSAANCPSVAAKAQSMQARLERFPAQAQIRHQLALSGSKALSPAREGFSFEPHATTLRPKALFSAPNRDLAAIGRASAFSILTQLITALQPTFRMATFGSSLSTSRSAIIFFRHRLTDSAPI